MMQIYLVTKVTSIQDLFDVYVVDSLLSLIEGRFSTNIGLC